MSLLFHIPRLVLSLRHMVLFENIYIENKNKYYVRQQNVTETASVAFGAHM